MAQPYADVNLEALRARGRLQTLLLYCPLDRKVTRHARRGTQMRLVCLDCGRSVEQDPGQSESSATIELARPAAQPALPAREESRAVPAARLAVERGPRTAPRTELIAISSRGARADIRLPNLALAGVAGLLVFLGAMNVLGQLVHRAAPTEPAPEVRVLPEAHGPTVTVTNAEGIGVFLRSTPKLNDLLYPVPDGTELHVVGPELSVDGLQWLPVQDASGTHAWVPASFTSLLP